MKWYWQLLIYLIVGLGLFYATAIWGFIKYYYYWDFKSKLVEFELEKIWRKAGVIEIYGGAETGKTLATMLLTQNLKGRKWNNVPNVIPGCQFLTLATLKKHCVGEFEGGIVGVNNVLFIDESWNFFSQDNLTSHGLDEASSINLLNFLTETSKTGWKVFYVTKKGIDLPPSHKILNANRSAVIRVLGTRYLCEHWRKRYYFLDLEFITDPRKFDHPSDWEINSEYAVNNDDHRLKKTSTKPWRKRIFGSSTYENQNIISIPYSEEILRKFDRT